MAKKSPTTKREVPPINPAWDGAPEWIRGFITAVAWSRRLGRFSDRDVFVCLREYGVSLAAARAAGVSDYNLQTISAALRSEELARNGSQHPDAAWRALETSEDSIAQLAAKLGISRSATEKELAKLSLKKPKQKRNGKPKKAGR